MQHKKTRITIGIIAGFIALTAIGGGIAILTGVDPFPPEWLVGTPFPDYTMPALILSVVVGGSALVAAIFIFMRGNKGILAAMAAGIIMMGYIIVEVIILKQVPPGPTGIEMMYFGLGLLLFSLAAYLWNAEVRQQSLL